MSAFGLGDSLGKLLARLRNDVVYTGHPEAPGTPLGCLDVDGMPRVATRDLRPVTRHWRAIEQARAELGDGPWSITLLGGALAERMWRPLCARPRRAARLRHSQPALPRIAAVFASWTDELTAQWARAGMPVEQGSLPLMR